ncbi:MAG: DUF4339 domain-containing protein [Verrucomicrobia bacterium]|nr:DUF4339 domain-containing protein [Verrucomicrobiota bacterium]
MATQEIYIRNANDTEARGPFGLTQLASLAEAGQITPETLVYDATTEQWAALSTQTELLGQVFPEKKKLILKPKEFKTLNKPDEGAKPIDVNDMLAAAEGRTDETADKKDPEIAMMRAAKVGTIGALVALLAAAAGEILPSVDVITSGDIMAVAAQPLVLFGALDVFLAVMLGLGVIAMYPFVRFRAALGFGVLAFIFYTQGSPILLVYAAAGCAGLYLCTIFVSLVPVIVAAAAAVGGMGLLAWNFLSQ